MKIPPRTLLIWAAALVLALVVPDLAFAKSLGGKKPAPSSPVPHHTTISSITATSITVKEPKGLRTLAITQFTQFTYKGSAVRWEALKPGMRVAIGAGTDPNTAERVDADDAPSDGKK
jgi:hypothetical protein